MFCWSVKNVLDLYADGRLTASRASAVRKHLKSCKSCRAVAPEAAPLAGLKEALGEVRMPAGLTKSILEAYRRDQDAAAPLWQDLRLQPAQAAALACLALMAAAHTADLPASASARPFALEETR